MGEKRKKKIRIRNQIIDAMDSVMGEGAGPLFPPFKLARATLKFQTFFMQPRKKNVEISEGLLLPRTVLRTSGKNIL